MNVRIISEAEGPRLHADIWRHQPAYGHVEKRVVFGWGPEVYVAIRTRPMRAVEVYRVLQDGDCPGLEMFVGYLGELSRIAPKLAMAAVEALVVAS